MKSPSALSLALRIAELIEAHSEKEMRAAIAVLEAHGIGSPLLELLAREQRRAKSVTSKGSIDSRVDASATTSKAVLQLRTSDPEKFHILSEFDHMVRRGQVLSRADDLRRFGQRISKDFEPRKSRKETIAPLMALLATRTLPELEQLIEFAASFGVAGDTDEYQRLARFLIKGKDDEGS